MAGSTSSDAATDAASIGVLNRIVTGSVSPRPVENVVVNSACVSGTMTVGGMATVVDGLAGADDADAEDDSQAEREAGPGKGRASQQCADVDRDDDRGGQQRDDGLVQ